MRRFLLWSGLCCAALAVLAADVATRARAESAIEFWINQNKHRPAYPSKPRRVFRPDPDPLGALARQQRYRTFKPPAPTRQSADKWAAPPNLEHIICRRECDGAELALGILPARERRQDAEAMCAAAGGSARTRLVVEKFRRGFASRTGPQLAAAGDMMTGRSVLISNAGAIPPPCPEDARERHMMVPILADATLRYGDIVATTSGFKMFVGKGKPPFREKDFVDASRKVTALGAISNRDPIPEASIETPPDYAGWLERE